MKRVFKLGILLGFIFSLCTAAQAATTACKINGVVTDSISGEAIPFVTIGIENNEGKVLSRIASDELGKFMITASAGQNYRLVVSSVGYGFRNHKTYRKFRVIRGNSGRSKTFNKKRHR